MEHSIIREKVAQSSSPFPLIRVFAWRRTCVVFLVARTVTLVDLLKSVKNKIINVLVQLYSFSLLQQTVPALHGSVNKTDQEKGKLEKSAALCCAVGK